MSKNYPIKKFKVNHSEARLRGDLTILQACEKIGLWIPRFCYSESLSIAGNCRMCLVEIEKSPKLMPACAIKIGENMKIHTQTNLVKKARESILEFLLINHPLDCPICDQGGECDLQDQAMFYGSDRGRFYDYKRSIQDKNGGPIIKTIMTRCIHCTRCIRFATEIAGVESYGTSGRGKGMEVGTYISNFFSSELSGNVIDLCPVGALTSKPYAFSFRPWELKSVESIDVLDGIGSGVRLDTKGSELMRILPRTNDLVNEQWISDKTRFAFDGLKYQRLIYPMIASSPFGKKWTAVSWKKAFKMIQAHLMIHISNPETIQCKIGPFIDFETISSLKKLMNSLGIPDLNQGNHLNYNIGNIDSRSNYIFLQKPTQNTENHSDALETLTQQHTGQVVLNKYSSVLLVACDPRYEASLFNVRLRRQYLLMDKPIHIFSIGQPLDLTYSHKHLGNGVETLMSLWLGKNIHSHSFLQKSQTKANECKEPLILLGFSLLRRKDSQDIIQAINHWARELECFMPGTGSCTKDTKAYRAFHSKNHLQSQGLEMWRIKKSQPSRNTLGQKTFKEITYNKSMSLKDNINLLHPYASSAGACDLGFGNQTKKKWKSASLQQTQIKNHINFLIGADSISQESNNPQDISIYQGHHGNTGAAAANYILPSTSYVEKNASFVNFQGRIQQTQKAITEREKPIKHQQGDSGPNSEILGVTKSQARDDWKILCALGSQIVKPSGLKKLNTKKSILNQLNGCSSIQAVGVWRLFKILAHLSKVHVSQSDLEKISLETSAYTHHFSSSFSDQTVGNVSLGLSKTWKTNFVPLYDNFYLTDVISQSSITMAKCSAQLKKSNFGIPKCL